LDLVSPIGDVALRRGKYVKPQWLIFIAILRKRQAGAPITAGNPYGFAFVHCTRSVSKIAIAQ
jgi:hypothetical protein